MAKQGTTWEEEGMGIKRVVGMCTSDSCHNMLSLLVTFATTSNTITTINEVLLRLFMLLLLTPWDIPHLTTLATLFNLL
jgi:hypothetical protein